MSLAYFCCLDSKKWGRSCDSCTSQLPLKAQAVRAWHSHLCLPVLPVLPGLVGDQLRLTDLEDSRRQQTAAPEVAVPSSSPGAWAAPALARLWCGRDGERELRLRSPASFSCPNLQSEQCLQRNRSWLAVTWIVSFPKLRSGTTKRCGQIPVPKCAHWVSTLKQFNTVKFSLQFTIKGPFHTSGMPPLCSWCNLISANWS